MRAEGYVEQVVVVTAGTHLSADHAINDTVLSVEDAVDFDGSGILSLNGVEYEYVSADIDNNTITLATGLVAEAYDFDEVLPVPGHIEKQASVSQGDGDSVTAVVNYALFDRLSVGIREGYRERVEMELIDGQWQIVNVLGEVPVIDGSYIGEASIALAQLSDEVTAQLGNGMVITKSATEPTDPEVGDYWIDESAGNEMKYWNGSTWESVQDQDIVDALNTATNAANLADEKVRIFYGATAPTGTVDVGDIWYDSANGNEPKRWDGDSWESVRDTSIAAAAADADAALTAANSASTDASNALAIADGKADTFFSASEPTGATEGDLWWDTANERTHRYTNGAWVELKDAGIDEALSAASDAQAAADGKITAFYQNTEPTSGMETGDLWYDTDGNNEPHYYDGAAWQSIRDGEIAQASADASTALSAANAAQSDATNAIAIADGKAETFFSATEPAGASEGDLWWDTTNERTHRYTSGAWVALQDTAIDDALSAASAAQSTADGKITAFYQTGAPASGMSEGDLWYDTDAGNKPYYYNGSDWVDLPVGLAALAPEVNARNLGAITTTVATSAPASPKTGDIWIDTSATRTYRRWDGAVWEEITDTRVTDALDTATDAANLADTKMRLFYQDTAPTGMTTSDYGDMWFETDNGNKAYRYTASGWQPVLVSGPAIAPEGVEGGNIKYSTLYADRLTVGSRHSESVLVNSTFEDPAIVNGEEDWNGFGGWEIRKVVGSGATVSEETANPISGSRSMKLTFPDATSGASVANRIEHPVVPGQGWQLAAKLRPSVSIDRTTSESEPTYVYKLWAHFAVGSVDPLDETTTTPVYAANGDVAYYRNANDTVRKYEAAMMQAVTAGATAEPYGVVTAPHDTAFTKMKVSVEIAPAATTAWSVLVDDVRAALNVDAVEVMDGSGNLTALIDSEGNAEFNNVYARDGFDASSGGFRIDGTPISEGLVTGGLEADSLTLAGRDIADVVKDNFRLKAVATGPTASVDSVAVPSNPGIVVAEIQFNAVSGHTYMLSHYFSHSTAGTSTGDLHRVWLTYELDGSVPTTSSSTMTSSTFKFATHAGGVSVSNNVFWNSTFNGRVRVALCTRRDSGSGSQYVSYRYAGTQPQMGVLDLGPNLGATATLALKSKGSGVADDPVEPPPTDNTLTKYTRTWTATWSSGYNGSGSRISNGSDHKQGYYSGTNGNTKAAIGFNDSDIRAKLDGVTNDNILKVEVYLYFNHWYQNSGGTAIIGRHGNSVDNASWANLSGKVTDAVRSANWPKPGGRWVDITSMNKLGWRNGDNRGILVGPGPTTSNLFYGTFNGAAQANPPKLRITYKK